MLLSSSQGYCPIQIKPPSVSRVSVIDYGFMNVPGVGLCLIVKQAYSRVSARRHLDRKQNEQKLCGPFAGLETMCQTVSP